MYHGLLRRFILKPQRPNWSTSLPTADTSAIPGIQKPFPEASHGEGPMLLTIQPEGRQAFQSSAFFFLP